MPISLQKRLNSLSIYVVWVSNITFFFFLNQRYILKLDYVLLSLDAEACFWIREWRENLVILYLAGLQEYICELTIGGRRNLSNNPHHFKMCVLWLQETESKFKPEVTNSKVLVSGKVICIFSQECYTSLLQSLYQHLCVFCCWSFFLSTSV